MNSPDAVLVTGAAGFVGQFVLDSLVRAGRPVRAIVRTVPPDRATPPGVSWLPVGDISEMVDWDSALTGIDSVVHLAGRAHVMEDAEAEPLAAYRRTNVDATVRLARAAAARGVRRFVFMSSVKAAGEASADKPLREEDPPRPQDAYGTSKFEAEESLKQIAAETGLSVIILRPPLVYGPGVRANFLRLMKWVDRGIPLPFGSICNQRSLVYAGNLADAVVKSVATDTGNEGTYFVADGEDLSTPELIRRIGKALGKPARLLPLPPALVRAMLAFAGRAAEGDRLFGSLCVSTTSIKDRLDWQPPYSCDEGLSRTVVAWRASAALSGVER